jgi:hypothetical protein
MVMAVLRSSPQGRRVWRTSREGRQSRHYTIIASPCPKTNDCTDRCTDDEILHSCETAGENGCLENFISRQLNQQTIQPNYAISLKRVPGYSLRNYPLSLLAGIRQGIGRYTSPLSLIRGLLGAPRPPAFTPYRSPIVRSPVVLGLGLTSLGGGNGNGSEGKESGFVVFLRTTPL